MGRQSSWFSALERNVSGHSSNGLDVLMDLKLGWAGKKRPTFASAISIIQSLQNVTPALENSSSFSKNPSRKHLHKPFQSHSFWWVPNITKLATRFAKSVWFQNMKIIIINSRQQCVPLAHSFLCPIRQRNRETFKEQMVKVKKTLF